MFISSQNVGNPLISQIFFFPATFSLYTAEYILGSLSNYECSQAAYYGSSPIFHKFRHQISVSIL